MRKFLTACRATGTGMLFLLPHFAGFLAFTLIPLGMSVVMALTDWDLERHNAFSFEELHFIGFANFRRLFDDIFFWQYFRNTLFLMMGIPFGIAASVAAAVALSNGLEERERRVRLGVALTALLLISAGGLALLNMGSSALTLTFFTFFGLILLGGTTGGKGVYRTLFYMPTVISGVAVCLLWKQLYRPVGGPVNRVLHPLLKLAVPFLAVLAPYARWVGIVLLAAAGLVFLRMLHRKIDLWKAGSIGVVSLFLGIAFLALPLFLAEAWSGPFWQYLLGWENGLPPTTGAGSETPPFWLFFGIRMLLFSGAFYFLLRVATGQISRRPAFYEFSDALVIDGGAMTAELLLIGTALLAWKIPSMVLESGLDGAPQIANALTPPAWLGDYAWAKPALMVMAFWAAAGSNSMILYLAGLASVPKELYEAAGIDGASTWQKFWYISWPQLAPVTFVVVVMAVVSGLQGGFESARVMTEGGPAGATTTLVYYIFTQGFSAGQPGYASAVAWLLFFMVFLVTVIYWHFRCRVR